MGDGKALQMGTSHELGQNFAKAFDIRFLDESGSEQLAWTTSWGVSTRMVGGLIMTHGDDRGLRLPPVLAPVQVVVLLVRDGDGVGAAVDRLVDDLEAAGVRVVADTRAELSFGRRVTDWELKGVPVRIEVGPRDLAEGEVTLVRRDTASKEQVGLGGAVATAGKLLEAIQQDLLAEATERRDERTVDVSTVDEVAEAAATGFARIRWDAIGPGDEQRLATDGVTIRCLQRLDGSLPEGDEDELIAIAARSY